MAPKRGRPAPVRGAEPPLVPALGGAGPITVVEGTTFCLSSATGDVAPGTPYGLFFRDARVLSRWELRLDGGATDRLSVTAREAFAARFGQRRPPQAGLADSTLLVVRERLVGEGMHELITLTNLGREATALTVAVHADADFADLFAVKEGRTPAALSHAEVRGGELLLTRADGSRGIRITGTGDPLVTSGALVWRTVIPPRTSWSVELLAQPSVASSSELHVRREEGIEGSLAARKIRDWRRASTRIDADDPILAQALRRSEDDLGALRIESGGGYAFIAAGAPWFMTLFGRDRLLTGWMTLPLNGGLALGTVAALAAPGPAVGPNRRLRCARCRATSTPRTSPARTSPRRWTATRPARRRGGPPRPACATPSTTGSGCPTGAGTRSRWTAASAPSTRWPATSRTRCGPASPPTSAPRR